MKIHSKANTDFTIIALENNLGFERIYADSLLEIMVLEASFIEGCMELGQIVEEALDATDVEVKKKRNIFERILDAIEALFGTFKEKVTVLMDKNAQWLKGNLVNITRKSMNKLPEIEAVPYWQRNADAIANALVDITTTLINRTKNNPEKFASMESLTEIVRQKIGGNEDLASDAKNFFRTGKLGEVTKPVKINGPSLSVFLDEMVSYVVQYDKIVVPRLNKFMNRMRTTVKTISSEAKTESFCFLENAMYNDTEIGLLPNLSVVMEESKPTQNDNGAGKQEDKSVSPTKVTLTGEKTDEQKKTEGENSAKVTEYCKNLTNILKILQGAALTVLEEKYITYINIFKAVVANDGTEKKEGEPTEPNNEQKEKTKPKK